MTKLQKASRRGLIVRRVAARKRAETWKRKRDARSAEPAGDPDSSSEAYDAVDELPESLVG